MILYRNIRARDLLEIFLLSSVTSLLLVRLYLYLSGYPQLGGGILHIAHVLWGGLLMMAGIVIAISFLGYKTQKIAALIGGTGFGVFIDEIGKFITRDNNYFFRPAVGIIYAIFVVLYLVFNYITRDAKLTSREYQLNALFELEEAVISDMDNSEKARAQALLNKSDPKSHITKQLQKILISIETIPGPPKSWAARATDKVDRLYERFWRRRSSSKLVRLFFIAQAGLFFFGIMVTLHGNIDELLELSRGQIDYGKWLLVGEFTSALLASILAIRGALHLKHSRLDAFEQFRQATLINLLLTEFFAFSRVQFIALPGFAFNLALIIIISYVIHQERRLLPSK